jgi:uncharacterized protein (DUF1501 family)
MKRRQFIQCTGAAVTLPLLFNGLRLNALPQNGIFSAVDDHSDRVLVLIQLNGGNDGLNMVLPIDQYDHLANVRGNILIPEHAILPMTDLTGLHPAMPGVKNLYDTGRLAVIQSAGYPDQNRSHFRSADIWTSGSPAGQFWATGWLGRHLENQHLDFPSGYPNGAYPHPFAITMGNLVSQTCQGSSANYSLTLDDPFTLSQLPEGQAGPLPDSNYGRELEFLRTAIAQSNAYATTIVQVANSGNNQVNYPQSRLAEQLRNVALLISGGLRTKVYVVSLGGFDTHANQVLEGNTSNGEHAELLRILSEAMAAFQEDLRQLGLEQRVLSMTFSEFGRRIRSNAAAGTDHGSAAPMLVFGSCVNPQILGDNPAISSTVSAEEGIPMQFDFRDIYGSILMDWFGVTESDVRTFLQPDFTHLPVLQVCGTTAIAEIPGANLMLAVHPNPVAKRAFISFVHPGGRAKLSVFNAIGNEIAELFHGYLPEGHHNFYWESHKVSGGIYYCRLQTEKGQQTKRMIKISN